jgi:CBS domain-containing protein
VSNIESEPPSPRAELLMAIVGPLVSIGIGFNFVAIASRLLPSFDPHDPFDFARTGPFTTLLLWLGPVNVMVGVFNLVPAFPLDGGRMLRALLWRVTRDLSKATLWASTIGQSIGWIFILLGIAMFFGARFPFVGGGSVSGLWLAFIGWFLTSAAIRSYASVRIQEALAGVTVAQLMRRTGLVVPPSATVGALVDGWFLRSGDHAFPVIDNERLVGLVSAGDVRRAPREVWSSATVARIMTPVDRLIVADPREEVTSALRKLAQIDVEQLPVILDGHLVGILERRHIARWLELRLGPPSQLRQSHAT